jgi:hypothetical protein
MLQNKLILDDFHRETNRTSIMSPDEVHYFNEENEMKPDTFRVIYANTKSMPVAYRDFDIADKHISLGALQQTVLKDALQNDSTNLFFSLNRGVSNSEFRAIENLESAAELLGFNVMDCTGFDPDSHRKCSLKESYSYFSDVMIDYKTRGEQTQLPSIYNETKTLNLQEYLNETVRPQSVDEFYQDVLWQQLKESYPFLNKANSRKLVDFAAKLSDISHEELGVVNLKNGKVESVESLFKGGRNKAIIDPKVLFKNALEKGADGILVFHNHPSSAATPSPQDCSLTERIRDSAERLNIKYVDHFVVGKGKVFPDVGGYGMVQEYQRGIKPKRRIQKSNDKVAER